MTGFILNRKLLYLAGLVLFLTGWKLLSARIGSDILLPSPEAAFRRLTEIGGSSMFWNALGATALRTFYGFAVSFLAGVAAGSLAGIVPGFRSFISPLLTILRTVPILSLILLAMLWFVTDTVPVFVCFMMVFPVVFANVLEGVRQVDSRLLEMGALYGLSPARRFLSITLPSLTPFLLAGADAGIGMAWKVTIAAEVLSQPKLAVGSGIQWAQMSLETSEVLAWTAAAIFLSGLSEFIVKTLGNKVLKWRKV